MHTWAGRAGPRAAQLRRIPHPPTGAPENHCHHEQRPLKQNLDVRCTGPSTTFSDPQEPSEECKAPSFPSCGEESWAQRRARPKFQPMSRGGGSTGLNELKYWERKKFKKWKV